MRGPRLVMSSPARWPETGRTLALRKLAPTGKCPMQPATVCRAFSSHRATRRWQPPGFCNASQGMACLLPCFDNAQQPARWPSVLKNQNVTIGLMLRHKASAHFGWVNHGPADKGQFRDARAAVLEKVRLLATSVAAKTRERTDGRRFFDTFLKQRLDRSGGGPHAWPNPTPGPCCPIGPCHRNACRETF